MTIIVLEDVMYILLDVNIIEAARRELGLLIMEASAGVTVVTVAQDGEVWNVDNIYLPYRFSGINKSIEIDGWYDPATGAITVNGRVNATHVDHMKITSDCYCLHFLGGA